MKKTALFAAAAALFAATPAFAQSGGSIGLNYTNIEDEADGYQLDGAYGSTSGSFGFQVDGGFGNIEDALDTQTIAGHAYWNGGGWRIGGVYAYTNLDDGSDSASETAFGVEGTWDIGTQAVALASYTIGESELGGDVDTSFFDIGLNYYFTENLRVGASYGFGSLEQGSAEADTNNLRLSAEWQPWTTPVSFTFGYNSFDADDGPAGLDTWSIGARWNFGGSLRERDNATPFDTRTGFFQRLYDIR